MRLITSDRRITESAVIDLVDCLNGRVVKPPPWSVTCSISKFPWESRYALMACSSPSLAKPYISAIKLFHFDPWILFAWPEMTILLPHCVVAPGGTELVELLQSRIALYSPSMLEITDHTSCFPWCTSGKAGGSTSDHTHTNTSNYTYTSTSDRTYSNASDHTSYQYKRPDDYPCKRPPLYMK